MLQRSRSARWRLCARSALDPPAPGYGVSRPSFQFFQFLKNLPTSRYLHTYMHAYMHTCIHAYIHTYVYEQAMVVKQPNLSSALRAQSRHRAITRGRELKLKKRLNMRVCVYLCLCPCLCLCVSVYYVEIENW